MLEQILGHIHNWFQVEIRSSTYVIENGSISLPFLQNGQYFRIMGSIFNDGLYQYGAEMDSLQDEIFDGTVWALAVPKAVVELSGEIEEWNKKYKDIAETPYTSESFAGYSYSKAGAGDSSNSGGWQAAFRGRLNQWRKLR